MPIYTNEQIACAREMDIITFLELAEGFSFKQQGNSYRCEEHSSLTVNADRRRWYWNSQNTGGNNAIDYCTTIKKMRFPEALQAVLSCAGFSHSLPAPAAETKSIPQPAERSFKLPERFEGKYSRVFAYLVKSRRIDNQIIQSLIDDKTLYQDTRGNCVFVGRDEQGTEKYACIRGTLTDKSFRGEISGSDKSCSFAINGTVPGKLFIFESPIDALSHATLVNMVTEKQDAWKAHSRLSLGGTTDVALRRYLKNHPDVKNLYICLDNDTAGQNAAAKLSEKYAAKGYTVTVCKPKNKDYNEDLLAAKPPYTEEKAAVSAAIKR